MKRKRTTVKDLAKAAGLSPSSVSRALNNHPRISKKTKAYVLKLAREMGYKPNLVARGLVTHKSFLLGLLVYDFRNPFYAELTRFIQDTAEEYNFRVIPSSTDDDPEKAKRIVESFKDIGVDGFIFASCQLNDPLVEELLDQDYPLVLANRRIAKPDCNYVVLDNSYGAYMLTSHLIRLGYQRIAMIGGPLTTSTGVERYRGYVEAMKEKGLEVIPGLIKEGLFFSRESGYSLTKRLMTGSGQPEAIFCCDDYMALGAMNALSEMDLRVPQDIALVGFDDAEISSHPKIMLTTVSQDVQQLGMLSTKNLLQSINGDLTEIQHILLEPHLVIRESCGYKIRGNYQS